MQLQHSRITRFSGLHAKMLLPQQPSMRQVARPGENLIILASSDPTVTLFTKNTKLNIFLPSKHSTNCRRSDCYTQRNVREEALPCQKQGKHIESEFLGLQTRRQSHLRTSTLTIQNLCSPLLTLTQVEGTPERPRLAVFRSSNHIYAQVIDDSEGNTLAAVSTLTPEIRKQLSANNGSNTDAAKLVGAKIAELCKQANIELVCFDRGGFRYHGRVRALADAAREGGLNF